MGMVLKRELKMFKEKSLINCGWAYWDINECFIPSIKSFKYNMKWFGMSEEEFFYIKSEAYSRIKHLKLLKNIYNTRVRG